ncbi:MAG TPA: cation-translocating P-type ATPase [Candidatus Desulfaltia sp.]|nr:cation-translocating P-type ATPase [Candidatus Desulfaltia sp.]
MTQPNHSDDHDHDHSHGEGCGCGHDHEHENAACSTCTIGPGPACTDCDASHGDSCAACGHEHKHERGGWDKLIALGTVIAIGITLNHLNIYQPAPMLMLVAAMVYTGYPLAESGVRSLLRGSVGINLLVSIAAIGATLIGQYEEGALVVFLFSISLRLEVLATDRARHAVQALMKLRPEVATIRKGEEEVTVPIDQVIPGEVFIVRPGDRVPLDGVVVDGETTVDQSAITGESVPVEKRFMDEVYAGTINLDGYVAAKTKRAASETMLASILRMVSEAEERRSPTETIVNRFARYYTPLIIGLAVVVAAVPYFFYERPFIPSIYGALVLLVIGCPCALTIATPVAMVSAITSASRNGVLVKGSTYIEQVSRARVFTFDKTGTLTKGRLAVTDVIPTGVSRETLLSVAAALEENSKHPIAYAIKEQALKEGVPSLSASEFRSQTGRGVEAVIGGALYRVGSQRLFSENGLEYPADTLLELEGMGKTTVILSRGSEVIGLISLMDESRRGAGETIQALRRRGMKVDMLTGDNENTARAIAEQLGFNGYHAGLLPDEKVEAVEGLKVHGPVVMVGDGVNDAPALAAADVGVAMGGLGSDIALETADVVLLEDDLSRLEYLLRLSSTTVSTVHQNIAVSVLVKLLIVALAAVGAITLWMAVILGDVGLTLLVILNSVRISGIKP